MVKGILNLVGHRTRRFEVGNSVQGKQMLHSQIHPRHAETPFR